MQLIDLIEKSDAIDDDIKIYRYLNPESFERLLSDGVSMTRMKKWPDRFETADFEFLQQVKRFEDDRSSRGFFASCWTFDAVKSGEIDGASSYLAAKAELQKDGSAAMWEAYCANGGVRVCTSVGKLKSLFKKSNLRCQVTYCGSVKYCAVNDSDRIIGKKRIEETFFYKRVGYRHEVEYRFITYLENEANDYVNLPVDNYLNLLDEVLIFPLKGNTQNCLANSLHQIGAEIATIPGKCTNFKNGSTFCRTSQLYGMVSDEYGSVGYIN